MKLTAKACAKINLTLDIIGVREDGYHLLQMIMQSVSLFDTVTVESNKSNSIAVASTLEGLGGTNDITYKAAQLFFEGSNIVGGANIHINKCIPCAAGLGGGSADAAAVLVLLNAIYGLPLTVPQLETIALKLGADVPYFLHGGTVFVSGIGENFKPLPNLPDCYIVIAKNAKKPSTGEMYRKIDSGSFPHPDNNAAVSAVNQCDLKMLCENVGNVFQNLWDCREVTDIFKKHKPLAYSLSGSGPSYFGVFENEQSAKSCLDEFTVNNIEAYLTMPTSKAIIFE